MASSGSYDSQPARRNSGSQLIQELEALSQSLYMSPQPLLSRRTGSLSLPNAKNLETREQHAMLDEAIPLPGLTNARHNSMDPTASRNVRHSIAHSQTVESRVRGAKAPRLSTSATSGINPENVDIRGRRSNHSLSPFRRRKGEELNRADDDRNFLLVHGEEEDVGLSKKMEHKHSAFWTWKPVRALSHIGMHRFNCIFSAYVNAIHGLSPSINGLRLCVNLRRKESRDGAVQTMPARVFQSVAEFDESLRIHCHVYGTSSRHGRSHGTMKFQSRPFVISVVAVDAEELDFGKHHVDLGILLQEAVQKHPAGEDSDDGWNVRFALSGKARGAELVVGLGYEILDKDERYHIGSCRFKDYAEHQAGRTPSGVSKSLPSSARETPKTRAAPGFTGAAYHSGSPLQSNRGSDDLIDFIRMAHLNLDDPGPAPESGLQSQMFQTENSTLNVKSEGRRLEEIGLKEVPEQEEENSTSDDVNHSSDLEIENAEDEGFFDVEEQGVELVESEVAENKTETTSEQLDKEGSVSGGHEIVKEVIQEASQRRLVELDFISQQIKALESEILDKTATQQSAMEPSENQDSKDYRFQNDAVNGGQNTDEVLTDDDVSAVEGEFLHLLETEEIGLDSEENMQKSSLKDGTADSEEDIDQLTSILAELGETEMKQMSHVSDSKTRAKMLEVEETEDLMQKWGLNKNVFKNSSRNSDPIGNFSDKAMKKQIKRLPDLGDGLGSHVMQVQTRDGGMLASMNPAHFRSGGRLVMHMSKPVVLPAEMGDTAVEILQNMAGMGTTHMTAQVMDCMPLDNITGKTVEQISFEGMASAITKSGYSEQHASLKNQAGLIFQVTRFHCGGFVVGVSFNHSLCDGRGAAQFLMGLAEIARGEAKLSIEPVWEREDLKPRQPYLVSFHHEELRESGFFINPNTPLSSVKSEDLLLASFFLNSDALQKIKRSIVEELKEHCTTFDVLAAFAWRARTRVLKIPINHAIRFLFGVDARGGLDPPLPQGYYGNGVYMACAFSTTAEEVVNGSLSHSVKLIKKAKLAVNDEYVRSGIAFLEMNRSRPSITLPPPAMEDTCLTDWRWLGFNQVDFRWGDPIIACLGNWFKTVICPIAFLPPPKAKSGVTMVFCVPRPALEALETELHALM